jgi:hypothetical protein
MVAYPKAEQFARTMMVPVVACPVTKELYGLTVPLLDRNAATMELDRADIRGPAREAALAILEERVQRRIREGRQMAEAR